MSRIESQAVGGFYKTQDPIRPLINRHFAVVSPSDDQTYAIVDPCAGEGEALRDFAIAVFGSKGRLPKLQIHAIELESDRYRKLSNTFYAVTSSPHTQHTHRGDGLHASVVGNASALWLNPPYDLFRGQRFESRFLRKWGPVVAPSGQLILIVPEHALQYLAADLNRLFEDIEILRYPEPEYSDFKQVVVLASRRLFDETAASTALPPIGDLASPPSKLRPVPPASMTSDVNGVDIDGVLTSTTAWCRQAGYDRPAAPPQIGLAMRPKPAHVALALGSGVFNGVRLSAPRRADLLAKAVFRRRYVDSESKKNEKGEEVKLTQVEKPELKIVVLDLSTGEYKSLSPDTEPTEATAERPQPLENFADLLMAYGDGMVSAMRQRCPSLHNGTDEALSPLMREPFPAQAHAARTALKIMAQGETPLLLGEVGSGKSLTALQVAWSLHRRDVATWPSSLSPPFQRPVAPCQVNRVLIVCPPHLVQNWKDEIAFALSHVEVHELCSVVDVDKLAASSAPFAIGLLSRETMKLGSGVAGVTTGRCPACGTAIAADFASKLAESRACCEAEVSVPVDAIARLAASMRGLSGLAVKARRKAPPDYSALCRLAVMPLLRLLRRQIRQLCGDDKLKQIVGALGYADGDETRLRRILKRMLPRKRVWQGYGYSAATATLPPEARREDASSYSMPSDLATTFRVSVDAAKLYTALHALGTWSSRQCGERLYQHVPTPRRYPLARYITRKHGGLFDLLIADEFHEYSSDGAAQERALHRLVNAVPLVLPLTGSLMNGYAKSLFRNLWSVSRRMRDEFAYKDATKFAKLYGYQKRILTGDALKQARAVSFGSSSDRVLKIEGGERTQDAPGVLPTFVLRHVLPIAVTLHKRDIMPDDRVVESVADVIRVTNAEHARWAAKLAADLKQEVKRTRFVEALAGRLFGQLNEYPSYFDRASADTGNEGPAGSRSYTIRYPDEVGGAVVSSASGLPCDQLLDKERWLVEKLRSEIAEGRRVLLFLWHKDLAARLCRLVEDAIGEKPAFLDADKVPARKRQEWIDKNVVGKKKVMVTNPSCVMTGLNNLIWFSTAVFFENPGVNPFIARQAVGRLDRITQKLPVRVFWPVYEGVQAMLFELLQQKIAIAQQIDGIDPTAALEMVGGGDQTAASMDVGLAIWKYLGGD